MNQLQRTVTRYLDDEAAMVSFGRALGAHLRGGATVFLEGNLGVGKTTFCRGVLRAFGHRGAVKSPTYTLVEPYDIDSGTVYHFDLYRLGDPEELEFMGVRDYFAPGQVCLVEWPARGRGVLPSPDLIVSVSVQVDPVKFVSGRSVAVIAQTRRGEKILQLLDRPVTELPGMQAPDSGSL